MRVLNFAGANMLCDFRDKHERLIKRFELMHGENELEVCSYNQFYELEDKTRFFVYEGVGVLGFEDSLNEFDLRGLNVILLDRFLSNLRENISKNDEKRIKAYLKCYEINAKKGFLYLNPPFFEKVERELLRVSF